MHQKNAFTLIELLIAVTISAILFVGVLVFVSGSMRQNIVQEKMLQSITRKWDMTERLTSILSRARDIVWSGSTADGSGILLRMADGWTPFVLISTKHSPDLCSAHPDSPLAGTPGTFLAIDTFLWPVTHDTVGSYTLSQSGNVIYDAGTKAIGTWYAASTLDASGVTTALDHPSAIVGSGNFLYIADTLNHRILSYNTTTKDITELLGASDGISLPVDLVFSGSTLLIANAGNGNLLALQDGAWDRTSFNQDFRVSQAFSFDRITFEADNGGILSGPSDTSSFTFSGLTKTADDIVSTAPLSYTFSGGVSVTSGTMYHVNITGITNAPTGTGSHSMHLSFYSGATRVYEDSLPWYTIGDGSIETMPGNHLSVIAEWLDFPNSLTSGSWSDTIDPTAIIAGTPIESYTRDLPIENFSASLSGKLLSLQWKQYGYYDCLTEKHKASDMLIKWLLHK